MRKSRFTQEQVRVAVEQAEAGIPLDELYRKYGVSKPTFYRWRTKYGYSYDVSVRKACRVLNWPRSSHRYKGHFPDTTAFRMRLRELAAVRPRYRYRRLHILPLREG